MDIVWCVDIYHVVCVVWCMDNVLCTDIAWMISIGYCIVFKSGVQGTDIVCGVCAGCGGAEVWQLEDSWERAARPPVYHIGESALLPC